MLHLHEGPDSRHTSDMTERREKSPAPDGNRSQDLSISSAMCYHLSHHHGLTCSIIVGWLLINTNFDRYVNYEQSQSSANFTNFLTLKVRPPTVTLRSKSRLQCRWHPKKKTWSSFFPTRRGRTPASKWEDSAAWLVFYYSSTLSHPWMV